MPWYATLGLVVLFLIWAASFFFGDAPHDHGY